MVNHILFSQEQRFSDPYSEKIIQNPSFCGISSCPEIDINYRMNSYENLFSVSYNQKLKNHNNGFAFLCANEHLGKGTFNKIMVSGIFTNRININQRKFVNLALQTTYFQQNIDNSELIFSNQIDPETGIISSITEDYIFLPVKTYDFSFGSSLLSDKYRIGLALFHIDKLLIKDKFNLLHPKLNINFGKIFSIQNNSAVKNTFFIIPELLYSFQNNYHQIIYGIHFINNKFLTRFYLKQNIKLNILSGTISLGINYKNIRISYIYEIFFTKFMGLPVSYNQISLKYKFQCFEKRNQKNTIYCLNF